jgi:hypothetical protein
MAESHVVTGLVAKRAELAGRIEACCRELERLETDVGHLDSAIKLFAPDYKLESTGPRRRTGASGCSAKGNVSAWCWRSSATPRSRCQQIAWPRSWPSARDWRQPRR